MPDEIRSQNPPAPQVVANSHLDRNALIAISLGLLSAATILLWIYHVNRDLQLRIEAAEVWSDFQVRIAKATIEEDPNLRKQYTEEQDVLRKHAAELKERSNKAKYDANLAGLAALFVLLGTTAAVVAFLSKGAYLVYAGILLGLIGIGFEIRALF